MHRPVEGKQCRELLPPCPINKASLQYAANLRGEILLRITDGKFVYKEYFPESTKAKKRVINSSLMEELLYKQLQLYQKQVENAKMSPATFAGYKKSLTGERMQHWHGMELHEVTPRSLARLDQQHGLHSQGHPQHADTAAVCI